MRIAIALTIIIAACISSQPIALAGSWQAGAKVKQILVENEPNGARVYVRFTGTSNTEGCTSEWADAYRIYGDTAKGKYFLSLLTAAKLADRPVQVVLSGCDDTGRPIIWGVAVD